MSNNIFITYNPNSQAEESTALRLQTISNLYGFSVVLPFRQRSGSRINLETQNRINNSTFVVAFCVDMLSAFLKEELDYAISISKPIIVIYDNSKGKKINFQESKNIKEVFVDFNKTDDALHSIAEFLRSNAQTTVVKRKTQMPAQNPTGLGVALLSIGLGLLAAWAFSNDRH